MAVYLKDPTELLDYSVDWREWLDGDEITASLWTVPSGLTQPLDPDPTEVNGVTTVWLMGGTDGAEYNVTNRITTVAGRISERTLTIKITQR